VALEHIKEVRDKVVEDLEIQKQMYAETDAGALKSEIAELRTEIDDNLKP
jgi:hypothetical protein